MILPVFQIYFHYITRDYFRMDHIINGSTMAVVSGKIQWIDVKSSFPVQCWVHEWYLLFTCLCIDRETKTQHCSPPILQCWRSAPMTPVYYSFDSIGTLCYSSLSDRSHFVYKFALMLGEGQFINQSNCIQVIYIMSQLYLHLLQLLHIASVAFSLFAPEHLGFTLDRHCLYTCITKCDKQNLDHTHQNWEAQNVTDGFSTTQFTIVFV